jgi:hypothetical protein
MSMRDTSHFKNVIRRRDQKGRKLNAVLYSMSHGCALDSRYYPLDDEE